MKVSELMVSEVVTCTEKDRLGKVANLMWGHDIGFVPVISSETRALLGVITDRDGFIAAYFQGKPLWDIPVTSAMTTTISTCPPDADIKHAENLMKAAQVHRLPVVAKDDKLVGVVSINDLARRAARDKDRRLEQEIAVTLRAISQPRADAGTAAEIC